MLRAAVLLSLAAALPARADFPTAIHPAPTALAIDGNPAEWDDVPPLPQAWRGSSVSPLRLAWTADGLAGLAHITSLSATRDRARPWLAECVEIWVEGDARGVWSAAQAPHAIQVVIGPPGAAGPAAIHVNFAELEPADVAVGWRGDAAGGMLEFLIPARAFGPAPWAAGREVRLHAAVREAGLFRFAFAADPADPDLWQRPASWRRARLVGPGTTDVVYPFWQDTSGRVRARRADAAAAPDGALALATRGGRWAGVSVLPDRGTWDFSGAAELAVDVRNDGPDAARVRLELAGRARGGAAGGVAETADTYLLPGERRTVRIALAPARFEAEPPAVRGVRRGPRWRSAFDPGDVRSLSVGVVPAMPWAPSAAPANLTVFPPTLSGPWRADGPPVAPLPLVDVFGQFAHGSWPGRLASAEAWPERSAAEEADLAARPEAPGRSVWGGWSAGPRLEATGAFRTAKHGGRWWLVDPDGFLFWSHGPNGVRHEAPTPTEEREHLFAWLPEDGSPFAALRGRSRTHMHLNYLADSGRADYAVFDFHRANLLRKFGAEAVARSSELAHRRLRSWGMNTVGNWSASEVTELRRTPYTVNLALQGVPVIAGAEGYWTRFPDPFDARFAEAAREAVAAERGRSAGDPWCIGYFIHNELTWGGATYLAEAALASPPEQAARRAFAEWLRARYGDAAAWSAAWGASARSWEAFDGPVAVPTTPEGRRDLAAFVEHLAERYFSVLAAAVRAGAPGRLYLGCRFSEWTEPVLRASARHADVTVFNVYDYSIDALARRLPADLDAPFLIGEFHFGATDRGGLHEGLVLAADQAQRAELTRRYLDGVLAHPAFVGAHWFLYRDQPVLGRSDGENYAVGLVDVTDTPYPEMVAMLRVWAADAYARRARP